MESAASPEFFSEKQHSKTFAEESPTPIVWRDKRNADPEVFASINSCRPAAVKALGHMAVFDLRTLNGVPALAFARWSHPAIQLNSLLALNYGPLDLVLRCRANCLRRRVQANDLC